VRDRWKDHRNRSHRVGLPDHEPPLEGFRTV